MLIELFTDYIRNRKDLREYVVKRKTINERGEFNDLALIKIQENTIDIKDSLVEIEEKKNPKAKLGFWETIINFLKELIK